MSKKTTTASQSDWNRIDQMQDQDIDTSDSPSLDESFFREARVRMPRTTPPITIRLDPDVLD
jgi:hypothetical protein